MEYVGGVWGRWRCQKVKGPGRIETEWWVGPDDDERREWSAMELRDGGSRVVTAQETQKCE